MAAIRFICAQFLVLFLLAGCVSTGPSVAPETATLADVNRLSGLNASLASVRPVMRQSFDAAPGEKSREAVAAMRKASATAFDPARMARSVEAGMQGRLFQNDLAKLAEFYQSPLGRKVVALELAANGRAASPRAVAEGQRLYAALASSDPQRLATYRRVIAGLDTYTTNRAIADAVVSSMISGMTAAIDEPEARALMRQVGQAYRQQLRSQIVASVNAGAAYTYRSLSQDELTAYADFLTSSVGRRYYRAAVPVVTRTMSAEARAFGNAFLGDVVN